jgi:CheY-like chemotaxis protein
MTGPLPHDLEPELGRLLEGGLSRAVRTPLHSLLGFLELLAMSDVDAEQRRLIEDLMESSEDLLTGSDRIIWLVRALAGQHRPVPRRVDLAGLAAEVAAAFPVRVHLAPDVARCVAADEAVLHLLLTELVANACAHGAPPVLLDVTPLPGASPVDGPAAVRITVSDSGRGLPVAAQRVLTDAAGTPGPVADALGLVLVRRLAGLLDATLDLVTGPTGTRTTLTLPASPRAAAPAPDPQPEPGGPARVLHVLLVEDNATNRLLAERQIARLGHRLTAVATGVDGIAAAFEHEVDVVLMDRHLPDLDGCEAARRIRAATPPGSRPLPIVAVTADATEQTRADCTAAGMDEVLTKPVDLERLGGALARAARVLSDWEQGTEPAAPVAGGVAGGGVPPALRTVLARVDGDAGSAAELVASYLGELPGRRLRIQASLRRGEPRAVLAAAESLRASSELIGASAVSGACAALGAAADDDDLDAARAFLPSLLRQCQLFATDLAPFGDAHTVRASLVTAAD